MRSLGRCISMVCIMLISIQIPSIVSGDTVITAEEVEVIGAGSFEDSSMWSISSTSGFSQNPAQFSTGIVADGELSFTHDRPENFDEYIGWSESSPTSSNYSTGIPDGFYTWSRGPNITVEGFEFEGMSSMILTNVSLVIHFEIPDILYSDTVRIILGGVGSEKLVKTYSRTVSGVFKMNNPLIVPLDQYAQWDWELIEGAYVTIDYVSQGGGSDDSEVRVDAVGIKAKYLQPWYSFENVKATHQLNGNGMPVIDINPYEGEITGLEIESCGLTPNGIESGEWIFNVENPPMQELGRIQVYGTGNHTIWTLPDNADGDYVQKLSGDLLDFGDSAQNIRIEIQDGCVSGARVDVNDPHLEIRGSMSGNISGLSQAGSSLKIAMGDYLIDTIPINLGDFTVMVPIGYALPSSMESVEFGVASRFQWASDGSPEALVVHIESVSISGGFLLEWDRDPECIGMEDINLVEDGGGVLLPLSVTCTDDLTSEEDLIVRGISSDEGIVSVYSEGSSLVIQPVSESHGESLIQIIVEDQRGNEWVDSFRVFVSEIEDPPSFEGLPMSMYVEVGDTATLELQIYDPDTENPIVTSSRSWAVFSDGILSLTPVETGVHPVEITVDDGNSQYSQIIDVIVTSKSDLLVESVSISNSATGDSQMVDGQVGRIVAYVRNQGMGDANGVEVRCYLDGALVGTSTIGYISSGGLESIQCDAVFQGPSSQFVRIEVDYSGSILETDEGNNVKEVEVLVGKSSEEGDGGMGENDEAVLAALVLGVMIICLAAVQIGPGRVRKPFKKDGK
ncbi:MAG: hypothetical protein DBX04_02075 [Candidatus Poseidoniales archaeon]|nr:MAG: hypothetical protein DBX04_02075 [Candidatus Poseidoniales archaeon]